VYETSSDEDTTSYGSGGAQTLSELVELHIDLTQSDIKYYMEGLIYKLNNYVDTRMNQLRTDVWKEIDRESTSGN
jgi:hypothetical protein